MKTTEYVHRDEDGEVLSTVHVHVVDLAKDAEYTDDGRRLPLRIQTTGGDTTVQDGAVLVRAQNPNYWDVLDADTFAKTGYVSADDESPAKSDDDAEISFRTKAEAEAYADEHDLAVDKSLLSDDYRAAVARAAREQ